MAVSSAVDKEGKHVTLRGAVLSLDGVRHSPGYNTQTWRVRLTLGPQSQRVYGEDAGDAAHAAEVGRRLALTLKKGGAAEILSAIEKNARHHTT